MSEVAEAPAAVASNYQGLSYMEMRAQRDALDAAMAKARVEARVKAIEEVKSHVREFQLRPEDIFGRATRSSRGGKVAPKYRNPETGDTWTGRGKAPKWIEGKDRSVFVIAPASAPAA